jgi:hypothetical protein
MNPASGDPIGFEADIRPLFRDRDLRSMRFRFDLGSYDDVSANADAILGRLKDGSMPCDEAWPPDRIAVFESWILADKPR